MEYGKIVPCKPIEDVSELYLVPLLSFLYEMSLSVDPEKSVYWDEPNQWFTRTRGYTLLFYTQHENGYQIDVIATPLGKYILRGKSAVFDDIIVSHTRVLDWVKKHCDYREVSDELTIGDICYCSEAGDVKEKMTRNYGSDRYWIHYPEKHSKDYYQEHGHCILIESFRGQPLYDSNVTYPLVVYDGVSGHEPDVDFGVLVSKYPDFLPWGKEWRNKNTE